MTLQGREVRDVGGGQQDGHFYYQQKVRMEIRTPFEKVMIVSFLEFKKCFYPLTQSSLHEGNNLTYREKKLMHKDADGRHLKYWKVKIRVHSRHSIFVDE